MGFVSELAGIIDKFKPWETVYEYQQGLMFRYGKVIGVKKRLYGRELEQVKEEEKDIYNQTGKWKNYIPFRRVKLPKDWKKGFLTCRPRHPNRYIKDEILEPGLYFFPPIIYEVVAESKQDKVLDLNNISVYLNNHYDNGFIDKENPKNDSLLLSCNIIYRVLDLQRAYVNVDDYEKSLGTHTLSILARLARRMDYNDWAKPDKIEDLEKRVLDEVKKKATKTWGLLLQSLYITENVPHDVKRLFHEGGEFGIIQGSSEEE